MVKGRAKKDDFSFIIDKLNSRLVGWKSKLLNRARRLTLASSVLSSIPTYCMQINWLPQVFAIQLIRRLETSFGKALQIKAFIWWDGRKLLNPRSMVVCVLGKLEWLTFLYLGN